MTLAASSSSGGSAALGFIFIIIGIAAYFVPLIVGMIRHVPNVGSVAVINIFLGWTVVGWIVALAMAVRSRPPPQYVVPPGWGPQQQPPLPPPPGPEPGQEPYKPYGYQ